MANTIPANNNTGLYIGAGTAVPINGNVSANNISASGNVSVGGYIVANGSITTNANFVGDLVGNVDANTVSATGNISTSAFFIGDGSQLTNLPVGNYSNANVAAYLPVFGGNVNSTTIFGNNVAIQGRDWSQLQYAPGGVPTDQTTLGAGSWFYVDAGGAAFESNVTGNVKAVTLDNSGNISAVGNIAGTYFIGNGSQLTGVITSSYGNANVADFLPTYTGNITANVISTTGNIVSAANLVTSGANGNIVGPNYVSANFFIGDGSLLTNLPSGNYSNANVANYLPTFSGNLTAGNVSVSGNTQSGNVLTGGIVSAVGNVRGANFNTTGLVSATGNVTGNYIIGDGSQLTNLPAGNYSNSNVSSFLAAFGSNVVSTTGNVTASYFLGNGSQLTGITANYSNSNVVSLMAAFGSNTISTTGTVTSGNVTGSNILTAGLVSAAGNVTGNFFIGDGSQLTNLPSGNYSNANVANYLPTFSGNLTAGNVSVSGNITGANIVSGSFQAVNSGGGALKNAAGSSQLQWGAGGANNVTINVSTNINGANAQIDISPTGAAGHVHINPTGNNSVEINPTTTGSMNNMIIGNVTPVAVSATTVSATGNVTGNYFIGNGSQLTGIVSSYGNANVAANLAAFGSNPISTTGNITASYFIGNGSLLTSLTGANVTGTVANATFATTSGTATSATTAGTVTTNAQANITSVGTLTSLSVTGNTTSGNILTGGLISSTGNATVANLIINGANARFISDFGTSGVTGRTYFQSSGATTTFTGAIPGIGYTSGNGNVAAAVSAFSTTDVGNASVGGIYVAFGNTVTGYVGVRSATFGTGTLLPITFRFNNTEVGRFDTNGNLAIGNIAPVHKLVANGTSYLGGNVTMTALAAVGTYTATALNAITGVTGQYAAVSNGTGKNGGQMAYWDTTNSRWSWFDTTLAVS